ncbi:MAG: UDP-N-acetylmuramoyl-tripeptide--D-alanyl-D-alanine ligase [Lachnospiraceae bacterium]|nr:UDP-N-acetylmuramoyl-tripeptide--D-alanyl-D-alanine ligase [Lachnospiraceae bacterium]
MFELSVKDIVNITSGKLLCGDENTIVRGICTNSKEIEEGNLFVPIIGEKVDAHLFIESALEVGAATLTSMHSGVVIADKPYIQVSDTIKAMQDIGAYIRSMYHKPVVAVTGSVGKTTTRDMIATALSQCAKVYKTKKNYNSQVGVPITLSYLEEDSDMSVFELGMSDFGQMGILSDMVKPDICVITVIGVAHIEYLKTRENILQEKLSITKSMNKDGILFLNGDDDMLASLKTETGDKVVYYGTKDWCDYRAENIRMEDNKYVYDYVHGNKRVKVVLNALGTHNVVNSLAGMAIADYMNMDLDKVAAGFDDFSGMRQKVIDISGKYTIIDDTYNASPDSMKASINVLAEMDCTGKRIAVLGDMFELGDNSEKYHYEVGTYLADKNIDELVVIGELSQNILQGVKDAGSSIKCNTLKDNGEASLFLLSVMTPGDVVLIKGSNGMKMDQIVSNILGKKDEMF